MNTQVNHIIYAILNLAVFTGIIFLFSKIPSNIITQKENDFNCGTYELINNLPASISAVKGKGLFYSKCASCHLIYKDGTGPALSNFESRGPWPDRNLLYNWVKNPVKFMKTDKYTRDLKNKYGSIMLSFPDITNEEIDAIADYINSQTQ